MGNNMQNPIQRLQTGIPGLDFVTHGGLPRGRTSLISGTAGSAKTVFAAQFIAAGVHPKVVSDRLGHSTIAEPLASASSKPTSRASTAEPRR